MDGRAKNEEAAERLGANLRGIRRRAGFSQETLASRCRLHRTEIGLIEKGKRVPRVDTLMRIAGGLEVSVEMMLVGIEWLPAPPPPPPVGFMVQPERGSSHVD